MALLRGALRRDEARRRSAASASSCTSPIASVMKHFPAESRPTRQAGARPASAPGSERPNERRGRIRATWSSLTIDGRAVTVPSGTTIFDAARLNGIAIPTLCHQQNETPVGVCRVCVVDVGGRVYAASCVRACRSRMTGADRRPRRDPGARRTLVELLMADHPSPCARQQQSRRLRAGDAGAAAGRQRAAIRAPPVAARPDDSSLGIAVDHEACILCDRCIRGCDEITQQLRPRPARQRLHAGIAFDLEHADGQLDLRLLRRVHGLLPHRRAHQQARRRDRIWRASRLDVRQDCCSCRSSRSVSGTFLELNQGAVVKRAIPSRRDHLPRGRVRIHRVLHSRRARSRCYLDARSRTSSRPRAAPADSSASIRSTLATRAAAHAPRGEVDAPAPFPSTRPSICPTTIRSPSSAPAICSAR